VDEQSRAGAVGREEEETGAAVGNKEEARAEVDEQKETGASPAGERNTDAVEVCLLAPGPTISAWAAAAIECMIAETAAEVTLVIEDTSSNDRSLGDALKRLVELREWGLVAAAMKILGEDLEPLERKPIGTLDGIEDAEWIRADPITVEGWKNEIPAPAVERMAETDVAIRFGFGFLVGDALTAPDHGVLSFHHGNLRQYRGQPMGFWEFVHDRDTAGAPLQRITATLDGGEIVAERRVTIGDARTWGAVRKRLFAASEDMLADGVQTVTADDETPETVPDEDLGDLYTLPRGRPVLTYVHKTARGALERRGPGEVDSDASNRGTGGVRTDRSGSRTR
jgi:hypothetical protein